MEPNVYQGGFLLHLDLKGAPPKVDFLEKFIPWIATKTHNSVKGLLIEYENQFPFVSHRLQVREINIC